MKKIAEAKTLENESTNKRKTKRLTIQLKLLIAFGLLLFTALGIVSYVSIATSYSSLLQQIQDNLKTIAEQQAKIFERTYITGNKLYINSLARRDIIIDRNTSTLEKVKSLLPELELNIKSGWKYILVVDENGDGHRSDGLKVNKKDLEWFKKSISGEFSLTSPYNSEQDGSLVCAMATPFYDSDKKISGVLAIIYDGSTISETIKEAIVAKTGGVYILDEAGTTIAHKNIQIVIDKDNDYENSKTNKNLEVLGNFEHTAVTSTSTGIGEYVYKNVRKLAGYTKINGTKWTIIANAPIIEFIDPIKKLGSLLFIIDIGITVIALIIVLLIAHTISSSLGKTALALKEIAQGNGNLTVFLPLRGNDEITDISDYFNQTIMKLAKSVRAVDANVREMSNAGENLASNMIETASAINEISANIEGVKGQIFTQAKSVEETSVTIDNIISDIKTLNTNISTQATSVVESSAAIEEMIAGIGNVTQTLEKSDLVVKELSKATIDGQGTIVNSNEITKKITDESGGLIDASNVIQHIAAQTNLLAMNAAIEAAHAGDSGKGFAVVADEIRKLAEESSIQGKKITSTLKNLSKEIESLSDSSKTVEDNFNSIFSLADSVKTMSLQITMAMREQEQGSKEVLNAIRDINTVTVDVKEKSDEMLKEGRVVAAEMKKLDMLTSIITQSMDEMSAGAIQINNAVQEVNNMTQNNKANIENLAIEVRKFKT